MSSKAVSSARLLERTALASLLLVAVTALSVLVISKVDVNRVWLPSQGETTDAERTSFEQFHPKGSAHATVGLLIVSDFECPFCRRFSLEVLPQLMSEYVDTDRIQVGFLERPLAAIHRFAFRAAESAECAGRQGRFWDYHDRLFGLSSMDEEAFVRVARSLDLAVPAFVECLSGGEGRAEVLDHLEYADRQDFTSTPLFVVGRLDGNSEFVPLTMLRGLNPISGFRSVLDPILRGEARQ